MIEFNLAAKKEKKLPQQPKLVGKQVTHFWVDEVDIDMAKWELLHKQFLKQYEVAKQIDNKAKAVNYYYTAWQNAKIYD